MRLHAGVWLVLVPALGTSLASVVRAAETPRTDYLTPAEFRARNPEPRGIDALAQAFDKALHIFDERSRRGSSAHVVLVRPDGRTDYGRDYYFTGSPFRLHEFRGQLESIVVGSQLCERLISSRQWECRKQEVVTAPWEIFREALIGGEYGHFECPSGTCYLYRLMQAQHHAKSYREDGDLRFNQDYSNNHYVYTIFVKSDGTPILFTERKVTSGEVTEPIASFLFDFDTPVPEFDLPASAPSGP